jgi:DUF971 family protein
MSEQPQSIKAYRDRSVLEIVWQGGRAQQLSFKLLRSECPCAGCVDEFTGIRTLDVNSIPDSIAPKKIELCGNYALKIEWNDGHSTGLYTWQRLARIADATQPGAHEQSQDL